MMKRRLSGPYLHVSFLAIGHALSVLILALFLLAGGAVGLVAAALPVTSPISLALSLLLSFPVSLLLLLVSVWGGKTIIM